MFSGREKIGWNECGRNFVKNWKDDANTELLGWGPSHSSCLIRLLLLLSFIHPDCLHAEPPRAINLNWIGLAGVIFWKFNFILSRSFSVSLSSCLLWMENDFRGHYLSIADRKKETMLWEDKNRSSIKVHNQRHKGEEKKCPIRGFFLVVIYFLVIEKRKAKLSVVRVSFEAFMPRGEAAKKSNSVENLLGRLLNKHYRLCRHHLLYFFSMLFSTLFTTFPNIRFLVLVPPSTMEKWHKRWRKREDDTPLWKWELDTKRRKRKKAWKVWENHSHCLVSFFL